MKVGTSNASTRTISMRREVPDATRKRDRLELLVVRAGLRAGLGLHRGWGRGRGGGEPVAGQPAAGKTRCARRGGCAPDYNPRTRKRPCGPNWGARNSAR